ncbi:MAG: BamA/TamA family outer membrane protein [Planctomycetes bacterium]|nr:BamA/TamA family outer membrane protein [Planctomycetota bacterium]MCW8134098.1 BamA/TamA family outer membrane protein [Planctomycetota bacterium]
MLRWTLKLCLLLIAPFAVLAVVAALTDAQKIDVGTEGVVITAIELQTFSEGQVFDRAPDSARRHEILGVMRTRQGRAFKVADLERDVKYLTDTSHMFRRVDVRAELVTLAGDAKGVRVRLIVTQPLVKRVRFVAPTAGKWSEEGMRDLYRFLGKTDTAEGSEFSLDRVDGDVRRLYETAAFIDVRAEHKYTVGGVDVLFRVIQNEPLALVTFSGIYRTGFRTDLERVISGIDPVRKMPGMPDDGSLPSPVYFPKGAFSGDVVTDASAANILGAKQQTRLFYQARGYPFVEVTERVLSLPTTFNEAQIVADYGRMRENMLSTVRNLIESGYGGRTVLVFEVFEGEEMKVGTVLFRGIEEIDSPGNDALSTSRFSGLFAPINQIWYGLFASTPDRKAAVLGEVMRLKPGELFVESDAIRDAEALQAYMRQRGWLDARVSFSGFQLNQVRSRINVIYHVEPGSVYAATDLRIEYATRAPRVPRGAEPREYDKPVAEFSDLLDAMLVKGRQLTPEEAAERYGDSYVGPLMNPSEGKYFTAVELTTPMPWDDFALTGAPGDFAEGMAGRVRILLANKGYSNVEIEFDRVETEGEFIQTDWKSPWPVRRVSMILRVQQGYQSVVGNVRFRGNIETRDDVLRRYVNLYPGETYDRNRLRASTMRLQRTQWFEQAAPGQGVQSRTSPRLVVSEGEYVEYTDVDFDVIEGRTNRLNFAAGFNSNTGFTASVDLTLMNFDISSLVSWIWGEPNWSFTGAGQSLSFTAQPPLDRYQIYRISFNEPWLFGYPVSGGISGEYTSINYADYTRSRLGFDPYVGWRVFPDVLWSFGYSYSILELSDVGRNAPQELRDEQGEDIISTLWSEIAWTTTDNPAFPTRGFNLTYRFSYTGGLLLGGTVDFWRMRATAEYYLPLVDIDLTRTLVLAFSATAQWQDVHSETEAIPFVERFLLGGNVIGGRGLLRGFSYSGVGPSRSGVALGGNFMVNGFVELRFPVFPGTLWLVAFVDYGELSPTLNTFNPTGWTVSGGFGLRLLLPILPVPFALDFGFPIINQPGNREQVISINLGFGF